MSLSPPARVKLLFSTLAFGYSFAAGLPMGLVVLFIQGRGVGLFEIGVLLAVQSVTAVVLDLPTGALADIWGRKKVLVLAFVCGAAAAAVALVSANFIGFLAVMLLSGACRALLSGTSDALFVDTLHETAPGCDLQGGFSQIWIGIGLGIAAGALTGGWLPGWFPALPAEGPAVLTRLSMPILFSLGVWSLLAVFGTVLLHEPARATPPDTAGGARAIVAVVRQSVAYAVSNRFIGVILAAAALAALAMSGIETFWQPRFAQILGGAVGHARLFGGIAAATFVASALGPVLGAPLKLLVRGRLGLVSAAALALLGAAALALALHSRFGDALVCFWMVYLANGLGGPILQTLYNEAIPAERRATLISFLMLCMRGGVLAGGLGLGWLASHRSIPAAWIASGCVALAAAPLYLVADRLRSRAAIAAAAASPPGTLPVAPEPVGLP